jgi:hypothetical protein
MVVNRISAIREIELYANNKSEDNLERPHPKHSISPSSTTYLGDTYFERVLNLVLLVIDIHA